MELVKVAEKNFPESSIGMVCVSTGGEVSDRKIGVSVTLWGFEGKPPHAAEIWDTETQGDEEEGGFYAEIGLGFDGNMLTDYDGVADLPREIVELVKELGYEIDEFI